MISRNHENGNSGKPETQDPGKTEIVEPDNPTTRGGRMADVDVKLKWLRMKEFILVAVLVVCGVCAGGFAWWSRDATAGAQSDCTRAARNTSKASKTYTTLLDGDAKSAADVRPGDLKDGGTLAVLQKAMRARTPKSVSCPTPIGWFDRSGLDTAKTGLDSADAWYVRHTRTLKTDARAVTDSRDAKTLADGQALYDSSDGRVADGNTRTSLQDALKRKDAQAVKTAMDGVNKSRDAKTQADQQAQADAAAQQQAVQDTAPAYTGNSGYTSGGNTGGYGSGYAGGTPSHQAPAPASAAPAPAPAPSTPAPAPAQTNSGGFDWNAFDQPVGPPVCHAGEACGIG